MAAPKLEPTVLAHLEWLSFVRPIGLVVSAPALVRAGAILERSDIEGQRRLRECVVERTFVPAEGPRPCLPDFKAFARDVLEWNFDVATILDARAQSVPSGLEVALPEDGVTLRPDFAVREPEQRDGASPWQLLVHVLEPGADFDLAGHRDGQRDISAHGRMERLLRQSGVAAGLIFNGRAVRLVSAPRGESSGWLDFKVEDMLQTAGRPICTAMRLLLREQRLLALPRAQRLPSLLEDSRKFQNEVSERLAEQVLHALYELLRGFQAAHDASKGELLREVLAERPDEVYRALLTVILRLVFLLFTEERDLLPEEETFVQFYSLAGLHERLREDAALFPDTMDQRFGAWAQLLVLFRMVHDGASSGAMHLPARHGVLFDPDRFKFLEGRSGMGARQITEGILPPLVPDGTIFRALEKLLVLDGERISYRALDVEQIGSVYETMMGFRLETATGRSVAIKAAKKHGAPATVDIEALLAEPANKREKWLQDRTDRPATERVRTALKAAASLEDLHAALQPIVDLAATPDLVPLGAMVLQPSEERRHSGSHYTPRALTGPIVRTTLEPILARLRSASGQAPRPEEILELKVCDPAMGSGAFLVEACRQLGDALVESWRAHGEIPAIPADEDELVHARRLVAQRCLYGVDRNPVAVDLSKVSLWLVTLARDHALTFVDHALRHGDSLVGLSRRQLEAFHWQADAPGFEEGFEALSARDCIANVTALRRKIREAGDAASDQELRDLWDEAQFELGKVRLLGDLVVAAWFEADKPKDREAMRVDFANAIVAGSGEKWRGWLEELRHADQPVTPFHWELELPEVFERTNPGFDALIANPPYLGGKFIAPAFGDRYVSWLKDVILSAKGSGDLIAFFLHRMVGLARLEAPVSSLATKTLLQGDTREIGLHLLLEHGHSIFAAQSARPWPGEAGVHFVRIHLWKGSHAPSPILDNEAVPQINSWLKAGPELTAPLRLAQGFRASSGTSLLGEGFIVSPDEARELLRLTPHAAEVLRPFLNGEDLVRHPESRPRRFAIDFGNMSLDEAQRYGAAFERIDRLVRPQRERLTRQIHEHAFWKHWDKRPELYAALEKLSNAIVFPLVSKHVVFQVVQLADRLLFSHKVGVIASDDRSLFAVLQSQAHTAWAGRWTSTRGDTVNYSISDVLTTFPCPSQTPAAALAGQSLLIGRGALMLEHAQGLTAIYNRFHDPEESSADMITLRNLHSSLDRAVLDAYGWSDVPAECQFLLEADFDDQGWGDKKKPWRYRWPDEVRDEVLARLLELNARRAEAEKRAGAMGTKSTSRKSTRKPTAPSAAGDLFE